MSYPVYEEMQDSGVEWLGSLPAGWRRKRLKYISIVQPSNVDKKSNDDEELVLLCNYSDVYNNELINSGIEFMKATATHSEIERFLISQGDVIVTKDSESPDDIAVPAYVAENFQHVLCGYHLTHIKPMRVFGKYLFRLFQSKQFNGQFVVGANGVTRYGLPQHVINNAFISLPSFPDQRRIAAFLDAKTAEIDELIALKEQQVALLQRKRMALISRAVTKGLDPHAPMRDSGIEWLGEVPEGWEVAQLHYHYSVQLGKMLDTSRITGNHLAPYLRNIDVQWGRINITDLPQMDFSPQDKVRLQLQVDDLLVCEGGEVGRTAIWKGELDECYYQKAIHRLRRIKTTNLPRYMYYIMIAADYIGVFLAESNSNTIDHLTAEKLQKHKFPFPPFEVQQEIITYLDHETAHIDSLVAIIQAQTEKLRTYRQALITAAVTGKIDVRGVEMPPDMEG